MTILPSTLRPFPSLRPLPDADLVALSRILHSTQFRTGAQICREGDSGDTCYFLVEGDVEVTTQLGDGRRIFLATLAPGTIFGQGALAPGRLRSADVRALCNVHVLALSRPDHQWALDHATPWAIHLQKLLCIHVIRQLRSAIGRLRELAEGVPAKEPPPTSAEPALPKAQARPTEGASPPPQGSTLVSDPLFVRHDASTTGRLLTLIAETEALLAGEGVDLGSVKFVVDSDAERRLHRRKS